MKTTQMRAHKCYLFRAGSSKKVNHHHMHLAETPKQTEEGRKLYEGTEGWFQVCPERDGWRREDAGGVFSC